MDTYGISVLYTYASQTHWEYIFLLLGTITYESVFKVSIKWPTDVYSPKIWIFTSEREAYF